MFAFAKGNAYLCPYKPLKENFAYDDYSIATNGAAGCGRPAG